MNSFFAPDKRKHFVAGFVIFVAILLVSSRLLGLTDLQSIIIAFAASLIAGGFKEFFDRKTGGDVETKDFYMTCFGGTAGVLITGIVLLLK